jgi:Fic family protein
LREAGRSADATRIARDFVAAGLALGAPDDVDATAFARAAAFSPLARAGVRSPEVIVGYRDRPVFIAGSRHVPPQSATLMDAVDAVFECIRKESDTWIRAVLGHFFFVYVHPLPDGNGRVGRFLMNVLLVASGYLWTVIRVSEKPRYFAALERASIEDDATALSTFVVGEMAASGTLARRTTKAKRRRDRR